MSLDKYPSIVSRQMEAVVYLSLRVKIQRIIHGRAEIWNLSSSVHIDIKRVSEANE